MSNILQAILNIVDNASLELKRTSLSKNRMNNMGIALEEYIRNSFAGTFNEINDEKIKLRNNLIFSYLGNQNNPPDMILKGGDAIEVKKLEGFNNRIALNSSHPKNKLYATDKKITDICRNCEDKPWEYKDIIYAIGVSKSNNLQHLYFIYGDCYAAEQAVYSKVGNIIKEGVQAIGTLEFSETKELGRVNKVDPLGITNLRIRGMWDIENPLKVFKSIYKVQNPTLFGLACLMRNEKFESFPDTDQQLILNHSSIEVKDVTINNPDNPAKLINAKLTTLRGN